MVMEHLTPEPIAMHAPWRAQGDARADSLVGKSPFDEIVVGTWLHVEAMDRNVFWMRVGPLVLNVTTRGGRPRIRIDREPDEHPWDVKVLGDVEQDQATEHHLRLRAIAAYEAVRGSDRTRAPDPKRLRRELKRRMGAAPVARGG